MNKIKEFDRVILSTDLPESGLKNGDIGNVVTVYNDGEGYEVEFMTFDGETVAVETLLANQVRKISFHEMPHVREMIGQELSEVLKITSQKNVRKKDRTSEMDLSSELIAIKKRLNAKKYVGKIKFPMDGLVYQSQIRSEWEQD